MTAIPAINNNLKGLPEKARGYLVIEIISEQDQSLLNHSEVPDGLEIIWLINALPDTTKTFSKAIIQLPWLNGEPTIWVAAELEEVLRVRHHFTTMPRIKKVICISVVTGNTE